MVGLAQGLLDLRVILRDLINASFVSVARR
jgi:hypothetical protein